MSEDDHLFTRQKFFVAGGTVHQGDRVADHVSDLIGDSVEVYCSPSSGFHDVYQDFHWYRFRQFGAMRSETANPWMRDAPLIQDAEDLFPIEIQEVEWSEVGGHAAMLPHSANLGTCRSAAGDPDCTLE